MPIASYGSSRRHPSPEIPRTTPPARTPVSSHSWLRPSGSRGTRLGNRPPQARESNTARLKAATRSLTGNSEQVRGLVIVGDQGPLDGCADLPVEPDDGVEREQPLDDPGP